MVPLTTMATLPWLWSSPTTEAPLLRFRIAPAWMVRVFFTVRLLMIESVPPLSTSFSLRVKLWILLVPDEYVIVGAPDTSGITTSPPAVGTRCRSQLSGECHEPPAEPFQVMAEGTVRSSSCSTASRNARQFGEREPDK